MKKLYIIPLIIGLGMVISAHTPDRPRPAKKVLAEEHIIGYHDNGVTQLNANLRKNKLNGTWNSWYKNGIPCDSGKFVGNPRRRLEKLVSQWENEGGLEFQCP
jgi:hypothetical protein